MHPHAPGLSHVPASSCKCLNSKHHDWRDRPDRFIVKPPASKATSKKRIDINKTRRETGWQIRSEHARLKPAASGCMTKSVAYPKRRGFRPTVRGSAPFPPLSAFPAMSALPALGSPAFDSTFRANSNRGSKHRESGNSTGGTCCPGLGQERSRPCSEHRNNQINDSVR